MDSIRENGEMEECEKGLMLRAMKSKSISDVLEEVGVLIDVHHFNAFWKTKSSLFLNRIIANQNSIDTNLLKKAWRTMNCSPKTLKLIREIKENLLVLGREMK